jgi:hypothetical protein
MKNHYNPEDDILHFLAERMSHYHASLEKLAVSCATVSLSSYIHVPVIDDKTLQEVRRDGL